MSFEDVVKAYGLCFSLATSCISDRERGKGKGKGKGWRRMVVYEVAGRGEERVERGNTSV
jgi:hypothetical protein